MSSLPRFLFALAIAGALPVHADPAADALSPRAIDPAAAPPATGTQPADDGSATKDAPAVLTPQREADLAAIYADIRRQYDEKTAATKTKDLRIVLQNRVISFMEGGQDVVDWTGVVKSRGTTPEGDAWISIEISDGVTVSTWQTRFLDGENGTLIKPYAPQFDAAHTLKIGQPVIFSGRIIEAVNSTDDEMVARPQLIARFSSLKAAPQ